MTRQEQANVVIRSFSEAVTYGIEQIEGGSIYYKRLQAITVQHLSDVAGKIVGSETLHDIINGGESPVGSNGMSNEDNAVFYATQEMAGFLDYVAGT